MLFKLTHILILSYNYYYWLVYYFNFNYMKKHPTEARIYDESDLKSLIQGKLWYDITWPYFEQALWEDVQLLAKQSSHYQHIFSAFSQSRHSGNWFCYGPSILTHLITPEWELSSLCLGAMYSACRVEKGVWQSWLHTLRMAVKHFPNQVREILDGISNSDCANN